jgi:hypothetical protein
MFPEATTVKELVAFLRQQERRAYRFMAERLDDGFQVTRLIIGPQASWRRYEYANLIFNAGIESGEAIADWLESGTITTRYHESFPLTPFNTQVTSSRYPSHSQVNNFTLSKPFTMYRVAFSQAVSGRNYECIAENAPFFLSLWEAERHLLYDIPEEAVTSPAQTPEAGIYVFIEHSDAWLERIHFSLIALEIQLAGHSLKGTKLKVVGTGIQPYDGYLDQNIVTIPLPDGRPDYLKIALLRDGMCYDYYIDERNFRANPHNPRRTNVTFAEPEPQEKIRELIDRGEGKTIEFKADISLSSDKLKWLKTVAAFANGEGGSIIVGVKDEDGSPVGISSMLQKYQNSIAKLKDALTLAISDTIDPVPDYELLDAQIDGHDLLVITCHADMTKCYAIYYNKDIPTYYIRRGATTRIASNNEVQELIRLRSPSLSISPFNNYLSFS